MSTRSLSEIETHLNITAEDRNTWFVFTDDPVMQRKFEKIGAKLVRTMRDGVGKEYTLRTDQVVLRTGKRKLSDRQKAELAGRLRPRAASSHTVEEN